MSKSLYSFSPFCRVGHEIEESEQSAEYKHDRGPETEVSGIYFSSSRLTNRTTHILHFASDSRTTKDFTEPKWETLIQNASLSNRNLTAGDSNR